MGPDQYSVCCGPPPDRKNDATVVPSGNCNALMTAYPPDPRTECCGVDSRVGNKIVGQYIFLTHVLLTMLSILTLTIQWSLSVGWERINNNSSQMRDMCLVMTLKKSLCPILKNIASSIKVLMNSFPQEWLMRWHNDAVAMAVLGRTIRNYFCASETKKSEYGFVIIKKNLQS